MKKTLITLAAMTATLATAANGNPVVEYDSFSGLTTGDSLLKNATVEDGSLHVNAANGTYSDRSTLDISDENLTLAGGLTITFTAQWVQTTSDSVLLSLGYTTADDKGYLLAIGARGSSTGNTATNGQGDIAFSAGRGNVAGLTTDDCVPGENPTFFTLTSYQDEETMLTYLTLYANGEQVAAGYTDETTKTATTIERLTFGGWSDNSNGGITSMTVEDLAIYDYAMSGTAVKSLYAASVPEPTTATLSLLALAGLAARRCRK